MPQFKIALNIPFEGRLSFNFFIPESEAQTLEVSRDRMTLRLRVTRSNLSVFDKSLTDDEIAKRLNIGAESANITVSLDISDEVALFMQSFGSECPDPKHPLSREMAAIYREIHKLIVETVNKLVEYVRAEHCQFWLSTISAADNALEQFFWGHDAVATIDDIPLRIIRIGEHSSYTLLMRDETYYLSARNWDDCKNFVSSNRRADLTKSLIANAYDLMRHGHRRSALIEATTAVEVALTQFGKANADNSSLLKQLPRSTSTNLRTLVEKFGFRGSFDYLIPTILTEEQMPISVIEHCRKAINERNNVVHNGTRDINEATLGTYLNAAKRACECFASLCI